MNRERAFALVVAVLVMIAIGVTSELILRLAGRKPLEPVSRSNEPLMLEPDAERGWRNRPGAYRYPPYLPGGEEVVVTILEDGRRATGPTAAAAPDRGQLVLVGGSLTFGWAVSDADTFAWKLQEALPDVDVRNYGTAGYGTYQSLMTLERVLPELESPALVLYGFYDWHEGRNVATANFRRALSRGARRGHVALPYVSVEDGALVRHPPESYRVFPFRTRLATAAFLERLTNQALDGVGPRDRRQSRRDATLLLLREAKATCERHGVEFGVLILEAVEDRQAFYSDFLSELGVRSASCVVPIDDDLTVLGEGHPNGKVHTRWARCALARFADLGSTPTPDRSGMTP